MATLTARSFTATLPIRNETALAPVASVRWRLNSTPVNPLAIMIAHQSSPLDVLLMIVVGAEITV